VQDRSKTNVFVIDFEEEEIRKKTKLRFALEQSKEQRNNEYNRSSTIKDLPLLISINNIKIMDRIILLCLQIFS
jgi:hypothetical protein